MSTKKKILLFTDWYEPGYKAGGPIRSCVNFVQHMKDDYQLLVFTADRDLGDDKAYDNIIANKWQQADNVSIYYSSPDNLSYKSILAQINLIRPDFIYLNSMFSKFFTIYPLLMVKWNRIESKIILAPRGMLRSSALKFKSVKKKIFLSLFKSLGFQKKTFFQASDETELTDIKARFGDDTNSTLAPNFPPLVNGYPRAAEKKRGELAILYVGRIHPIKFLDFLLNVLMKSSSSIALTVVGNLEDVSYWQYCSKLIAQLPANITVSYVGEISNDRLPEIFSKQHIFSLPTKGENFGHAIFEALSLGKPVLISDQTPWKNLAGQKVGWDLPLDQPKLFLDAIEYATQFDQAEYNQWSRNAWQYATDFANDLDLKQVYLKLFS